MSKEIFFKHKARKKLSKGVQKLTDAVKATMGPMGRNVLIHREGTRPFLTKDGVTVAQEVYLKDKLQDMGAQIVKEVSANTAFEAGDGTTTSTVLANAIFQLGIEELKNKIDPIIMKRGMDDMVERVIEILKTNSKEIQDEDIVNVATISANGNVEIGQLIADAIKAVGRDGIISVEENSGVTDELVLSEGLEFSRGYLSPHFITNQERNRAELENPLLLISETKISQLVTILPILEKVQKSQRPLLIVAEDIDGEALSSIIVNKMRGSLNVTAVKAPGFGASKAEQLKDLAIISGGVVVSQETGKTLESLTLDDLGSAERAIITSSSTTIVNGDGDKDIINETVESIKAQIESQDDGELKNSLTKRLTRLTGGAAVIKVGAQTEFEMSEKKDRYDDAVEATKSAIAEGIVIGGGSALLQASLELERNNPGIPPSDYDIGGSVIIEAIQEPMKQILRNAGLGEDEILGLIEDISEFDGNLFGYNAVTREIEPFFETGVIDPLKVERIALVNANSIASTLLTTDVAIFEKKRPETLEM